MKLYLLPLTPTRTLLYASPLTSSLPSTSTTSTTSTSTPSPSQSPPPPPKSYIDRATTRAATLWTKWESSPTGWQKTLTTYGNRALQRIPYQEWGLKSVPPLSARLKYEQQFSAAASSPPSASTSSAAPSTSVSASASASSTSSAPASGEAKTSASIRASASPAASASTSTTASIIPIIFPPTFLPPPSVLPTLHRLATERQSLHRSRMWYCLLGMPLTLPVALVPIVPNVPFFYLVFRAWSHWRAYSGGEHVRWLLEQHGYKDLGREGAQEGGTQGAKEGGKEVGMEGGKEGRSRVRLRLQPSERLDEVYRAVGPRQGQGQVRGQGKEEGQVQRHEEGQEKVQVQGPEKKGREEIFLQGGPETARAIAEACGVVALGVEVERAVRQVERAVRAEAEAGGAAREPARAQAQAGGAVAEEKPTAGDRREAGPAGEEVKGRAERRRGE